MRTTFRATAVGAAALMVGMLAGPAAAQEEVEGGLEECIAAVEANLEESEAIAAEIDGATRPTLEELAEQGLSPAEICAIYGVEVLDLVIEAPPEEPEEPTEVAAEQEVAPVEVLGVQLARTGIDALVLALIGVGLLGLGFVAVRRKGGATEA